MAAAIVFSLLMIPNLAHAYIDPGTGSMLFHILIASVIGALFTVKQFFHRITSLPGLKSLCGIRKGTEEKERE